ncbi:uncharacterized protein LOC111412634 [Olea europaea subsp. europaea]|uniref:Uncharacterized protein LOC111412634 n=1 Tax=Olea europaea subsp. europaea TaxID=158383 RepID=A0A8S0TK91_OLEEU|nr:uncharacterized protein LOC111412634 [Olea europaea subsp. europaea]
MCSMSVSREWTLSAYARESKGKRFVDDVLDYVFWKECANIVQLTEPLVRILRIVDSDEKSSMGYLYEAIHVAKNEIEHRFQRRKNRVAPYLQIIQNRWDSQLRKNLHATEYWLNPSFQYNNPDMENHKQTISGLLDVIERYTYGQPNLRSKLTSEMRLFRQAHGDLGRLSAVADRHRMSPDEWWMCYGCSATNLQTLAIRVLSQTCSSSGCERNWSIFEQIHSKKRNRLE